MVTGPGPRPMRFLLVTVAFLLPLLAAGAQAEEPGERPEATAAPKSVLDPERHWPIALDRVRNMGWADFDLDGDADVALHYVANRRQYINLYRNEGGMNFTAYEVFQIPKGEVSQIRFEDVDGDTYPDLLVARFRGPNSINRNNGRGGFESRGRMLGLQADSSHAIIGSDIDGDGDLDLVVANAGKSKRYLNDGRGGFSPGRAINRDSNNARSVVAGDVDGDGDMDLLPGTHYGYVFVHKNHGDGRFDADGYRVSNIRLGSVGQMVLVDADGDGDLDLFAAARSDLDYFRNRGDGNFDPGVSLDGSEYVFPDDVDHDGDLDIVTYPAHLLLGNGQGAWLPTERIIDSESAREEALQDVDNDKDLDLVLLTNWGPGIMIFLNNTNSSQVSD